MPQQRASLTPNERAVLIALLARGGTATQLEVRRETGIPRSSLSGRVASLTRRGLLEQVGTSKRWRCTSLGAAAAQDRPDWERPRTRPWLCSTFALGIAWIDVVHVQDTDESAGV